MDQQLAIAGGLPLLLTKQPHFNWPPNANDDELREILQQRNSDISIKGRTGPVRELEEAFKLFMDNKQSYAISFNSGTSALLAAYVALGITEGDEVIGPALTYHAALSPLKILGASIRLADVEKESRCISPDSICRLITTRTKAITVVHQWGHPADMDKIVEIANEHNLKIIEDCSHSHGSKYKEQLCGTFGDIAVFSLQAAKMIYAGEGGILTTNSELYHDRATLLGHYRDRSRDEILNHSLQKYWPTGFGLKLRISPLNAIIASHSLKNYNYHKEQRHKCLNYFNERLTNEVPYIESHKGSPNVDMGAWYGYKPLYKPEKLKNISKEILIKALQAEGMEVTDPSGAPLSNYYLYKDPVNPIHNKAKGSMSCDQLENTNYLQQRGLSLPTFSSWDTDKELIDNYIQIFKKVEANANALKSIDI